MEEAVKKASLTRKLLYIEIPIFFLSLVFFGWVMWTKVISHPAQSVHYHAGFIVVKDNQLVYFSGTQYMSLEPCKLDNSRSEVATPQQEQIDKAHLHDNIGDVVHVESQNALWKDLFINIHYPINYQNVTAYINNQKTSNFQDQKIQPYQSLVLFIGNNNDVQKFLSRAVTQQHIQDIEQKSTDCGTHE